MKIQKKYLEVFFTTLKETSPKLADARVRDSFLKELADATDTFIKDRNKIYETFCEKKEDGTPDIKEGKYYFPAEQIPKLNDELVVLLDEEIDLNPSPKIKEIIEQTEYGFKTGEVEIFDEITKLL